MNSTTITVLVQAHLLTLGSEMIFQDMFIYLLFVDKKSCHCSLRYVDGRTHQCNVMFVRASALKNGSD